MLNDINDSEEDANELANLLKDMLCKIDLIPANDSGQKEFKPSPQAKIDTFMEILKKQGVSASVRGTLGGDISAACGQLKANSIK